LCVETILLIDSTSFSRVSWKRDEANIGIASLAQYLQYLIFTLVFSLIFHIRQVFVVFVLDNFLGPMAQKIAKYHIVHRKMEPYLRVINV